MLYAALAIGIAFAVTVALVALVTNLKSPSNGSFASMRVFTSTIAVGVGWLVSFVVCAVVVVTLISASAGASLEQLFTLTGSAPALIAKYAALVLAIALACLCLATAFVVA